MTATQLKFLQLIVAAPGVYAAELPRAKRGETIKHLELVGFIVYGPSGWIPTEAGTAALKAEPCPVCKDGACETKSPRCGR